MKVTRLGPSFPLLTFGFGITDQTPTGGASGQVVTSNGSNSDYWGENIARITANGSNAVLGPFANFISGSGISLSVSSNSMTITGAGSAGSLPWYDMKVDGGLAGNGVTDDTAAFQAAITAGTASGTQSRTFYFPPGTYLIGGALQDTGAFNGQILLPNVSTAATQITIRFVGAARPPFSYLGSTPAPGGYSIIKSTLAGASGTAACISGGNGSYPGTKNNVQVDIENLMCVGPDNPTFTFWNLMSTQGGSTKNLQITTVGAISGGLVQPTHSNSYGIKLPQVRNSNYTYVDGLSVGAFYTGVLMGEMVIARGLILGISIVGIEFPAVEHASLIVDMQVTSSAYPIKATGLHYCDILSYDFETGTGAAWGDIVYDLDDASNFLHGSARDMGYPTSHAFTKNGGGNFSSARIGALSSGPTGAAGGDLSGTYPNPSVVDDSHSHTTATAPGGGELLLSSTSSVPPVFGDILTNTDEPDFVYSS